MKTKTHPSRERVLKGEKARCLQLSPVVTQGGLHRIAGALWSPCKSELFLSSLHTAVFWVDWLVKVESQKNTLGYYSQSFCLYVY